MSRFTDIAKEEKKKQDKKKPSAVGVKKSKSILSEVKDINLIKYVRAHLGRIDGFSIPKNEHDQIVIVSDEPFNALTFLYSILEKYKKIDELCLSYYSFNMKIIDLIDCLMESGMIKKLLFQTSNLRKYGSDSKIPRKISAMEMKYGSEKVSGSFVNSHAKIMLCKIENDFYVVEGSGNMAKKERTEQYLIEKSEESYNFHKEWITNYEKSEKIK